MTEAETPKSENSLLGRVLNNNYRIDRLIGAGGMGEVYEGEHLFTGNRVAIKVVLQSLSHDEKVLGLFKREARILFKLTDEAIARYLDSFHEPALDRYCLVMDYIDGVPLSEMMSRIRPLMPEEALRLMRRLAVALERAHKLEIVHRDLSPDNVMLRGGEVDQAVLIDFGIARSAAMTEGTLHGQFAGKFKYVSPEQLGHFGGEVGPRTDVYGLALLIAAGLRGKALDMGGSIVEAVNARREIPVLEGVPPHLCPILAHMLEPDPANRPAGMGAVVRMLDSPSGIPPRYLAWGMQGGAQGAAGDRTVIAMPMPGGVAPRPEARPHAAQPGMGLGESSGFDEPITVLPDLAPPFSGLSQPGQTFAPQTFAPQSFPPRSQPPHSQPPHSQPLQSQPPQSQAPQGSFTGLPLPSSQPEPPPAPRRSPVVMAAGGVAVLALLGAGGWLALRPTSPVPVAEVPVAETQVSETPAEPAPSGLPGPDTATREGFLAAHGTEVACSYATRVAAGGNAGKIEVMADKPAALPGVAAAYAGAFGATPSVLERQIAAPQCAALDLLRGLQGREAEAPLVTLDTDSLTSGGSVIGRVSNVRGRTLWLFLVSASGAVFDLTGRLEPQADGSFLLAVGMQSASGKAEPQLIMALAAPEPLVSAATAAQGAPAASLLPAVLSEIASRKLEVGAQAAFLTLVP